MIDLSLANHDENMNDDLVSIIMPSYNCGNYVEETIRSVQNQTYQNWEIVFVDDCSNDDTISRVSRMRESDPRIRLFRNKKIWGLQFLVIMHCKKLVADGSPFWIVMICGNLPNWKSRLGLWKHKTIPFHILDIVK